MTSATATNINRSNSFVNALKWWPLQGHNHQSNHAAHGGGGGGVGVLTFGCMSFKLVKDVLGVCVPGVQMPEPLGAVALNFGANMLPFDAGSCPISLTRLYKKQKLKLSPKKI
uniref:Uncharacterized protein n=1 Tax=Bactrocera dorsalis TaxID=27457 RepID=A0A034WBY2_BACDO